MPSIDAGKLGTFNLPKGMQLTVSVGSSAIVERYRGTELQGKNSLAVCTRTFGPYLFEILVKVSAIGAAVQYSIAEEIDRPAEAETLRADRWTIAIAGQSNGQGANNLPASIPKSIAGCQLLGKDNKYGNLAEPSHYLNGNCIDNWTQYSGAPTPAGRGFSCATSLANTLKRLTGADVLIVPAAIGSTSITHWLDQAYVDPPVEASLFGQMRKRIDLATGGDYSRLIILHHGHEAEITGTTTTRALAYHNLITAYRFWFGNVPIIFPQLSLHTDSGTNLQLAAGADTQWRLDQDYGDSSTIVYYATSALKTINSGISAASPDWAVQNTNGTNTITDVSGGVRLAGDGTSPALFKLLAASLVVGRTYRIRFDVARTTGAFRISTNGAFPSSGWSFNGVAQAVSASNLTQSGSYEFVVTYASGEFQIVRDNVAPMDLTFTNMTIEEAQPPKHANVFTYPTWDVTMNGSTDPYHISVAGQKVNGKRAAYVIASRILELADLRGVDGSGNSVAHVGHPHLTSARNVSGSTTVVSCFFNQALANKGADNLWLVEVAGVAQTISSVALNADTTRVDITLSAPITAGSATVSYGAVVENSDGAAFTNFVRNAEGLPPLRFYRYPVAAT